MSAHARQLAAQQGLHGLRLPDGQPSPFLHLHADDTTVHASSPADAQAILDGSVTLHIEATGARLQRSKSSGMGIGSLQHLVGPDPATAITFCGAGTPIRHLGIPLSTDPDTAATALYTDILQRLQARIARWSGFRLSLLGRAHVAKQVLVAMFTYHGTFIPVPEQLLRQLCTSVYTFVAANRPVVAGAALLYPSRDASSRALQQGGIALVDIRAQLTALQAKIIGRFLEPERIAWKAFFGSWLSMPLTAEQRLSTPSQQQHLWQLGRYLPFSSFSTRSIDAPRRVVAYIDAFRQLHPHRLVAVDDLPYQEVMSQPLFHSWQIQHMGDPISWEAWARQGRVRLQHLRDLILSGAHQTQLALQQKVALLLASMPPSWAAHVCGPSPQPTHMASAAPADSRVFCPDADGQLIHTYTVTATAALVLAPALEQDAPQPQLPADLRPVLVMDWDPTRPWHPRHMGPQAGLAGADAAQAEPHPEPSPHLHMVGAWSDGVLDPRSWGFGSEPVHEYVVRSRASRLRTLRRIIAGLPEAVSAMRPAIWPAQYGDEHTGIRSLEARWERRWELRQQLQPPLHQPDVPGPTRARGAPDPSTDAPWMHRSRPRPAPARDRRAQQLLLPAPAEPELQPGEPTPQQRLRAAQRSDDTDLLSLAVADPSSDEWAHTWRAIHSAALDRPGRVVAWRLLHGKLFVGAFNRHIHRGTPESHLCPHAACQDQLATLSHVLLSCPVPQAVWQWFAATWSAVTQQPAPPLHADLLLADDRRGPWQPAAECASLWQRLRLLVITQLWAAYCRSRSQPGQPTSSAHIAARVISAARTQMRCDWMLVGSDIRLRAGVLSHWLRGRQPKMTAEAFQSRWCHGEILCSRPEEETEAPRIHWSAAHPVPLPL